MLNIKEWQIGVYSFVFYQCAQLQFPYPGIFTQMVGATSATGAMRKSSVPNIFVCAFPHSHGLATCYCGTRFRVAQLVEPVSFHSALLGLSVELPRKQQWRLQQQTRQKWSKIRTPLWCFGFRPKFGG